MLNDVLVKKLQIILKEDFNKNLKKDEVAKIGEAFLNYTKLLLKIQEETKQRKENKNENDNEKQPKI